MFSLMQDDYVGGADYDDEDIGMTGPGGSPQQLTFGGDSFVAPPNKVSFEVQQNGFFFNL